MPHSRFSARAGKHLRTITREDVKRLVYERLMPGRAPATVRANLAPLREMLNHAVEDGVLATNPAARILKRRRETSTGVRRPPRFLTREELARLLETCRATANREAVDRLDDANDAATSRARGGRRRRDPGADRTRAC